jgi:hypothetical protein
MNQELEELIDLAIADGTLTDKKREILTRKAKELNIDPDEFDMILDGKLFRKQKEMQAQQPVQVPPVQTQPVQPPVQSQPVQPQATQTPTAGDTKKCPSCGTMAQASMTKCPKCGKDLGPTLSTDPIGKISEIISHVEQNSKKDPSIIGGLKSILGDLMD